MYCFSKLILFIFITIVNFNLINVFSFENGKCIKVLDGDTFIFLNDNGTWCNIRLFGIDAPEKNQEYGKESKLFLASIIENKRININVISKDKYNRSIGIISNKKYSDINLLMIKTGNAWYYEKYAKNNIEYKNAFENAKNKNIGLWNKKYNPIEPEKYRKNKK